MFFTVVLILTAIQPSLVQDISPLVDVETLSELSLEKLLQVKSTFQEPDIDANQDKITVSAGPEAMALQAKRKPTDRGGYHYHYEEEYPKKSSKKSVQSIFQVSVTTLAFLAFGGYLLCLIVQAVKGKKMMMMTTTTTTTTTTTEASAAFLRPVGVRKRRPTRRRPRRSSPLLHDGDERQALLEDDPDRMYYALVQLSEAYARYHTIDFKKFNYSSSSYVN